MHTVERRAQTDDNEGKSQGQAQAQGQAKHKQEKERERKGKQRQRKISTTRATLEETLARVDTEGARTSNLNALDTVIVSAKRILAHGGRSGSTDARVSPLIQVETKIL